MAVQSDTSSISYTGNNSTVTTYAVPFVFLENSHLAATAKVTATGVESVVTLTNHTGAGDANGGTVRTAVAVPATSTLTIFRTVPATQTTSYQEGGDFPAASHERALDKLTMLGQQNARRSDRAIRVTEADGSRNDMVAVANSIIGLDGSKQPSALTYAQVRELLAITGTTLNVEAGTRTFSNAAARALTVPSFIGQLGTQQDTAVMYISTGTSAGNWSALSGNVTLSMIADGLFTADATGRGKFATAFVNAALLASNAVETAKINNAAVTPEKLSQPLTLATSVATTSGTSIDFTGIPSWVKKIAVLLNDVSGSGTSSFRLQLGDAGGFEDTGYVSYATTAAATVSTSSAGSGFQVGGGTSARGYQGVLQLFLLGANTWVAHGVFNDGSTNNVFVSGSKALSATLNSIRLTTVNGTDTFDAGSVNIVYEG
jgi:hypothetical protein